MFIGFKQCCKSFSKTLSAWNWSISVEQLQLESEVQEDWESQSVVHSSDLVQGEQDWQTQIPQPHWSLWQWSFFCQLQSSRYNFKESIHDIKSFHQGTIVNIVEDCDISYTDLTQEQVEHIFDEMLKRTRLKKLNIRGNSLR